MEGNGGLRPVTVGGVSVSFEPVEGMIMGLQKVKTTEDAPEMTVPIFSDETAVEGTIKISPNKKIHLVSGEVQLVGRIELLHDLGNSLDFYQKSTTIIESNVDLADAHSYRFKFEAEERPTESYYGTGALIRYFVRVVINKKRGSPLMFPIEFFSITPHKVPTAPPAPGKMDLCTPDKSLRMDIQFDSLSYPIDGVIRGKVSFLVCQYPIVSMRVKVIRIEKTPSLHGPDSSTLLSFQIMDGTPPPGTIIPLRVPLRRLGLSPSVTELAGRFQLKYELQLSLIDRGGHKFFKKTEFTIYRE